MTSRSSIIEAINKYSLEIYDGLDKDKINIDELFEIIKRNDLKKLKSLLKKVNNKEKMLENYKKIDYLDQIIYLTDDRYKHLKDIRNLVNLDELIDFVLPKDLYLEKIKIDYSNLIIEKLLEKYYDYENIKFISELKENIDYLERKINIKIMKKIDKYYVRKITV